MKVEDSFPCSQEPTTGVYPKMIPVHNRVPYLFKIQFNISLPCS